MAGSKIDVLIESMGKFSEAIENLKDRAQEDRNQRSKEHEQNQLAIAELRQSQQRSMSELRRAAVDRWDSTTSAITALSSELREHAEAVSNIKPQVQALQLSRGKLAALAAVGLLALWLIGQAFEIAITQGFAWALKKIGG